MLFRYFSGIDFAQIHCSFLHAFSDYSIPIHLSEMQLQDLFERRGAIPELSIGAFDGLELVAFNWNALGEYNGALTVYDVATGVIQSYRRRGLAKALFYSSLPRLKQTGAQRYVLEVFENNQRAISLYEKVGFNKMRTLECFRHSSPQQATRRAELRIDSVQPNWNALSAFWDWQPSWKNSIDSIQRSKSAKHIYGAFRDRELIGYGIVFPNTGDIPQLAVSYKHRRQGAGAALLNRLLSVMTPGTAAKLINVDGSDRSSIEFLLHQ